MSILDRYINKNFDLSVRVMIDDDMMIGGFNELMIFVDI